MEEGVTVGLMLYTDDNLTSLALTNATKFRPILSLFNESTGVIGLKINIARTTALCMNTPSPICEQLYCFGMAPPDNAKHLGIPLV
jgi:hypothetical protein